MFEPIRNVSNPPSKPLLVWDGECGFCKYWVTVWQSNTGDRVDYRPFQEVYQKFPSIPLKEFKKASRLIEVDGKVYSGPDSAYRSFLYFKSPIKSLHNWYHTSILFRKVSNHTYNWIAKNRSMMFRLTKLCWGADPLKRKSYWLIWIIGLFLLIWGLIKFIF